jgi:hypothetical protein
MKMGPFLWSSLLKNCIKKHLRKRPFKCQNLKAEGASVKKEILKGE